MISWKLWIDAYARYESSGIKTVTVEANTLKEALLELVDKVQLYETEDEIEEYFNEFDNDKQVLTNFIENVEMSNGDGCDYIIWWHDVKNDDDLIGTESDLKDFETI